MPPLLLRISRLTPFVSHTRWNKWFGACLAAAWAVIHPVTLGIILTVNSKLHKFITSHKITICSPPQEWWAEGQPGKRWTCTGLFGLSSLRCILFFLDCAFVQKGLEDYFVKHLLIHSAASARKDETLQQTALAADVQTIKGFAWL